MTDKWAEHKQKFCGCKDASRLNRCQGRNNCELPEGHPERVSAAPRQPEGDAISRERVQAEADAFFDWPTADKSSVTTTSCLIFARCIAGMVAAERDAAIAELREECERLRKERDGIANSQRYGQDAMAISAERDTLRQQLAERDAQIASMRAEVTPFIETHWMPVARQRDKLAGLLREADNWLCVLRQDGGYSQTKELTGRIDAALAEVKP